MVHTLEQSKGRSQGFSKVFAFTLVHNMDEGTLHRKTRLRDLLARRFHGSQKELADASGLTEGRISQLLGDTDSFGERSARGIANELRLDARYFELGYTESEFVAIRRADVVFSNGTGSVVDREDDKPPLSFRRDYLRRLGVTEGNAVVVDADGSSNDPHIREGAVVLINRGDTERLNGEFFAFRHDGDLLIKRLTMLEGVGVLAVAENQNFKPKQKVYKLDEIQVIGRAVWMGIEL